MLEEIEKQNHQLIFLKLFWSIKELQLLESMRASERPTSANLARVEIDVKIQASKAFFSDTSQVKKQMSRASRRPFH